MKIIALYLPQYHPTEHNDIWWGKGFTEWTNVGKARPLFKGHYQPKVPADLGYYDLRLPVVREQQAELAREARITGFCYYHYWFGNGEVELELPFKEVVESGNPDFPFCVCWANETWGRKMWNLDGSIAKREILAEQKYLGAKDNELHFNYLLKAFKDERYIKVHGKQIFAFYRPLAFDKIKEFMDQWQDLAQKHNLPGFYFIGYTTDIKAEYNALIALGLDAIIDCNIAEPLYEGKKRSTFNKACIHLKRSLFNLPTIIPYKKAIKYFTSPYNTQPNVFPTLIPNWDHTPRSGKGGYLFENSTPELFEEHATHILSCLKYKDEEDQVIFLKSWNEWGEGNYMEPDIRFGKGYIKSLRKVVDEFTKIEG